jgi:hypothetical protein
MKSALTVFAITFISIVAIFILYLALHNIGDGEGLKFKSGVINGVEGDRKNNDINFSFENDNRNFYINRGLEYGCNLDSFKQGLIGKVAEVYYYDNIMGSHPYHIVKITSANTVWYSEE